MHHHASRTPSVDPIARPDGFDNDLITRPGPVPGSLVQPSKNNLDQGSNMGRRLGDVPYVATWLHCSQKTIRRLSDEGKIPGRVRLGRLVRFDLNVVDQWIAQGCPPPHRFMKGAKGV